MNLKEALNLFMEQFAAKGKVLPIFVNHRAFYEENPDGPLLYDTQVKFPPQPEKMAAADCLRSILARYPKKNAVFLVRDCFVEITTRARALGVRPP